MTDPAIAAAVEILTDELTIVSDAMIDAGSRAAEAITVEKLPDGKTRLRNTSEAQLMAAIWTAMLRAKLGERA